jgi:CubicO group peptidase (beta-lactamase class C family)
MEKLQFTVLFRIFLFRLADLDVLSADAAGSASKLLGQFSALLVFISAGFAFAALMISLFAGPLSPEQQIVVSWSAEHFLIATTMLAIGLFAILSWDSTFPNRKDVFVLMPLPVRARTLLLAKVAAVGTGMVLAVAMLHALAILLLPIALTKAAPEVTMPAIDYDSAHAPASAARMRGILDEDLASARALAMRSGAAGLAIGVLKGGERRSFSYGVLNADDVVPAAAITKTFTGLIFARMVEKGMVRPDEPLRELLPRGTVARPNGPEILLEDLAVNRSGLPAMPHGLARGGEQDPEASNTVDGIYSLLAARGVGKPDDASFNDSNLGVALLGLALSNRAGMEYKDLLKTYVTEPLGLRSTRIETGSMGRWDSPVLAPAIGIRATIGDLLTYLDANLHPDRYPEIAAALRWEQRPLTEAPGRRVETAGWMMTPARGSWWRSGSAGEYSAYAFFDPANDSAGIAIGRSLPATFGFIDTLGEHMRARMAGLPAPSVGFVRDRARMGGFADYLRVLAAYVVSMFGSGIFIFCCVLALQGLAAQLFPRRIFLRVSSYLQMAAFSVVIAVYFLEPKIMIPSAVFSGQNYPFIAWSPSYWFLGVFQQIAGSNAMSREATRAWVGMALALTTCAVSYALCYLRTIRQIVEQPDLAPATGPGRMPEIGSGFVAAICRFSFRTLLRSRQHRLVLALYLGTAFALTILLLNASGGTDPGPVRIGDMGATIIGLGLWVGGARTAFALPLELGANWVFRVTPSADAKRRKRAVRLSFYLLSVIPLCGVASLALSREWPWRTCAEHILVLALLGAILVEFRVQGPLKLPFTCSWLPGKSNFHITFLACALLVLMAVMKFAQWERAAFLNATGYCALVSILAGLLAALRWRSSGLEPGIDQAVIYEETDDTAVFALNLSPDGGY